MKNISIVGVGLIGGSLGLALQGKGYWITGVGRDIKKLNAAKVLGAVNEFTTDIQSGVKNADIVVVCTPVDKVPETIKEIIKFVKSGTIITDAGSTKQAILRSASRIAARAGKKIYFVGGHPLAGSEKSGVAYAWKGMYEGAHVVLVNPGKVPNTIMKQVEDMWIDTGAQVIQMKDFEHDKAVSVTSHLPHIIAFSECLLVDSLNKQDKRVSKLLAGSFKDITRIADSNPKDWAVICNSNKKELAHTIDKFILMLRKSKSSLNSIPKLEKLFTQARSARQNLLNI